MKKIILLLCCFTVCLSAKSQNLVLNGSLEDNTASANTYFLSDSWDTTVAHSWHIDAGTQDLFMSDSCGGAADGSWFVHTNSSGFAPYSGFCFELSGNLIIGHQYRVTYSYRVCHGPGCTVTTAICDTTIYPGNDNVNTNTPVATTAWATYMYTFTSTSTGKYLTVAPNNQQHNEIELDNFILEDMTTGIDELGSIPVSVYPNPASDHLVVSIDWNVPGTWFERAEIINALGKVVLEEKIQGNKSDFDVASLPSGMYMIRLRYDDSVVCKKICVN